MYEKSCAFCDNDGGDDGDDTSYETIFHHDIHDVDNVAVFTWLAMCACMPCCAGIPS
jgi:hypothetical protein